MQLDLAGSIARISGVDGLFEVVGSAGQYSCNTTSPALDFLSAHDGSAMTEFDIVEVSHLKFATKGDNGDSSHGSVLYGHGSKIAEVSGSYVDLVISGVKHSFESLTFASDAAQSETVSKHITEIVNFTDGHSELLLPDNALEGDIYRIRNAGADMAYVGASDAQDRKEVYPGSSAEFFKTASAWIQM